MVLVPVSPNLGVYGVHFPHIVNVLFWCGPKEAHDVLFVVVEDTELVAKLGVLVVEHLKRQGRSVPVWSTVLVLGQELSSSPGN